MLHAPRIGVGLVTLLLVAVQSTGQTSPPPPDPSTSQTVPTVETAVAAKRVVPNDRLVVLDNDGRRTDGRFAGLTFGW